MSVNDKHLIPAYQNATGYTTSYILSGSCLVVNKSLTQGVEIKGYKDLLKPELDGKIIMANPINSSSALAQLTNILLAMGGYEDDGAWAYVCLLYTSVDHDPGQSLPVEFLLQQQGVGNSDHRLKGRAAYAVDQRVF